MKSLILALMLWCHAAHGEPMAEVYGELAPSIQINGGAAQIFGACSSAANFYGAGQLADIRYQVEVTNPYQFNVGMSWYLTAWDYEEINGQYYPVTVAKIITPPVSQNVTPAGHHMVISGSYLHRIAFPAGMLKPTRCYTLVVGAVASGGGGLITVEQQYGFLQVGVRP